MKHFCNVDVSYDTRKTWRLTLHTLYYIRSSNYKTTFFVEWGNHKHPYMLEPIPLSAIRTIASMRLTSHAIAMWDGALWHKWWEYSLDYANEFGSMSITLWIQCSRYLWSHLTMFCTHIFDQNPILARISLTVTIQCAISITTIIGSSSLQCAISITTASRSRDWHSHVSREYRVFLVSQVIKCSSIFFDPRMMQSRGYERNTYANGVEWVSESVL